MGFYVKIYIEKQNELIQLTGSLVELKINRITFKKSGLFFYFQKGFGIINNNNIM